MEKERTGTCRSPSQVGRGGYVLAGLLSPQDFMEEAGRFLSQAEPNAWCIAAIDILHFRMFKKLYGREMAEGFLGQIAEHLEEVRREYGGAAGYFQRNDFCVILPWRIELVEGLWERIAGEISQIGKAISVMPVFGVSPIDDPRLSPEAHFDRATLALDQATARRPIAFYDPGMERELEEETNLLSEVTGALARDEFTFYVQPQCDITSGKVVGAESLVRWNHTEKGLIPPGKFIPVLERCGAVYLLD